jgi:hypothetical protein
MPRAHALAARWRAGAIQSACQRCVACGCTALGSLSQTLAVCCPPHRCPRVCPSPWRSAFQQPNAPSPMAKAGACARPWLWRARRRSVQACSLAREPSQRPTSAVGPGASAPSMPRRPCRAAASRVGKATPSTQHSTERLPNRARCGHGASASGHPCCSRLSGAGDHPGAAGPRSAWQASAPSPVAMPLRDSHGHRASRLWARRR